MTRLFAVAFDLSLNLAPGVLYEGSSLCRTFFRRHATQACHTRPPAGSALSGAFAPAPSSTPGADIEMLTFREELLGDSSRRVCRPYMQLPWKRGIRMRSSQRKN